MAQIITIPKLTDWDAPGPGWLGTTDQSGKHLKPVIKCKCGQFCGIALHHVHSDGRVTASFFHSKDPFTHKGKHYAGDPTGCGWHVFLQLADYGDRGEFPPENV